MALRRKPVYLDGTDIGHARSWEEVAELIHAITDRWYDGPWLSQAGNEGPDGFYLNESALHKS